MAASNGISTEDYHGVSTVQSRQSTAITTSVNYLFIHFYFAYTVDVTEKAKYKESDNSLLQANAICDLNFSSHVTRQTYVNATQSAAEIYF